jgi:glycosyltransferase involved in cell wall biosynthesis
MEEILQQPRPITRRQRWVVRGSAHIREQHRLLVEEEMRIGFPLDKPSPWIIEREEREYALADRILVLSTFARQSFERRGVPLQKLVVNRLGVQTQRFRASEEAVESRSRRVMAGGPLSALTVGTFSARKGGLDLVKMAQMLKGIVHFRFVGDIAPELQPLAQASRDVINFCPRVSQFELPRIYSDADVFVFPTIEDGFAVVLAQAAACGLPILTTTNCSGIDLVKEGETGWVLTIRNSSGFIARLLWCNENRLALAAIIRDAPQRVQQREWADTARDLLSDLETALVLNKSG